MASEKQAAKADTTDVQKQVDKINEQGFVGQKVDPVPNEEYALPSGPDAPSSDGTRAEQIAAGS